jgi:gas vesicle protein
MKKRSSNVALGAFLLAGISYVAGVLTAPKSGKATREDLHRSAQKAKTEGEQKLKELQTELSDLVEQGKVKAKTVGDAARTEYTEILNKAQQAKQKAREMISAVHEGDAEDKDLKKAIDEVTTAIDHLKKYLGK